MNFLLLRDGVAVVSNESNTGNLNISPATVKAAIADENRGITVAAFYLTSSIDHDQTHIANPLLTALIVYTGVTVVKYFGDEVCSAFDNILMDEPSDLSPCPCLSTQAAADPEFEQSNFLNDFFHPGSDNCYRSTMGTAKGSGQQCCYRKDGSLNFGEPGGGTGDRYSPTVEFWLHQWYDVVPWVACCKLAEDSCNKYYKHRPSDDCSDYIPPDAGQGSGDPHITTLDGKMFTFNGAGEFLMASTTLHNVTIQARMEVFGDTEASVYSALAIQTNDSSKIQVQRSNMNETLVLVDGESLRPSSSPIRKYFLKGVRVSVNNDLSEVRVAFTAGISVTISINKNVMSFITQIDAKFQGLVVGLLGNMNGDPEDDLRFPNGTLLKNDSSLQDIHRYGLEWLVPEKDSIFTYISPYDYNTYYLPGFAPNFDIPDPSNVSQEIQDLCGDSFECIFDAVTTGSLLFANETLVASATFAKIQESSVKIFSCGFPGVVEDGEVHGLVYLVNDTVEITCHEGYYLEGSSILTCQADGLWSSDLPQCFKADSGLGIPTIIGIIGATVVGVFVIFFSVLLVYRLKKRY